MPEHVLQDDRATLRDRKRQEASQRRAHDDWIRRFIEASNVVQIGHGLDELASVALKKSSAALWAMRNNHGRSGGTSTSRLNA